MCWLCQTTCLCTTTPSMAAETRRLDPSEGQGPPVHTLLPRAQLAPVPTLAWAPDLTPLLPPSCHPLHQGHQSREEGWTTGGATVIVMATTSSAGLQVVFGERARVE